MLKKIENSFVYIVFLIFTIYILLLNIINIKEMVILKIISIFVMILLLILLIKKVLLYKNYKRIKIISIVLLIFDFVIMLYFGYKLRVNFSWDYGIIQSDAINYALNGNISRSSLIYYIKYPNNKLLFILLSIIYRISHIILGISARRYFVYISIIIGSLLITISYYLTFLLAKKYKNINFALIVLIVLSLMMPLLSYSTILYSDTPSLLFFPLIILLYLKYKKDTKKNNLYLLLIGIVATIGFEIKATVIFVFISVIIDIICNNKFKNILKPISIMLVVFVLSHLLFNITSNKVLNISKEDINRYNVPYTHFVMMTLNESGGFNEDDVIFTNSFNTKEEKINENIKVIKERLNNRGFTGAMYHLLVRKMIRTWTRSDFAISDYVSRYPVKNNYVNNIIGETGEYYKYFKVYTDSYYVVTIIGLIISYLVRRKDDDINVLSMMIILMLFIFLTIWECNSRYVVQILPIIILLSMTGWINVVEKYLIKKK